MALQGMRFFACHGYYTEEQLIGNEYFVDIETQFDVAHDGGDDISATVNYERLFSIAERQMKEPRKLIETVAHGILKDICQEFAFLKNIRVYIYKMHPALNGEVKNSLVELTYTA